MSHLKQKSIENLNAVTVLINHQAYAASIHCAYYSCVQLMKHIVIQVLNKSENEIDAALEKSRQPLHVWLINTLSADLRQHNTAEATNFNGLALRLKKARIKADYKDQAISSSEALMARTLVNQITTLLQSNFDYE